MGLYDNQIAQLRKDLELLKNKQVIFSYEPKNPTTQTVWADPATQTTKFFDWKNWFTTSGWTLSNFTITSTITATDYNTITWTSWVINIGTSLWSVQYAINSGFFDMTTTTYFYWQDDIPNAIQTTTDAGIAVTNWGIIIAISKPNSDITTKAGIKILWTTWDLITADNIVANSITWNMIQANTITANKLSVSSLSAITANMGTITAWNITIDSSGYIKWGQSSYDNWTGFFLWYSSGYKLSIWNSSWNKLTWDWSQLSISGKLVTWSWSSIDWSYISNINAGTINSGTITSINITGWTITGSTFQTAVPNNTRAEITTASWFRLYDWATRRLEIGWYSWSAMIAFFNSSGTWAGSLNWITGTYWSIINSNSWLSADTILANWTDAYFCVNGTSYTARFLWKMRIPVGTNLY